MIQLCTFDSVIPWSLSVPRRPSQRVKTPALSQKDSIGVIILVCVFILGMLHIGYNTMAPEIEADPTIGVFFYDDHQFAVDQDFVVLKEGLAKLIEKRKTKGMVDLAASQEGEQVFKDVEQELELALHEGMDKGSSDSSGKLAVKNLAKQLALRAGNRR